MSFSAFVVKDTPLFTFGGGCGAGAITTTEGEAFVKFRGKRLAGFTNDGNGFLYRKNEVVTNNKIKLSKDRNVTDLAMIDNAIRRHYVS